MRAIIGLSGGFDLCVAAEGVETPAQLEALSRLGVHQAQGFLFGKAISPAEVAQMLSTDPLQLVA